MLSIKKIRREVAVHRSASCDYRQPLGPVVQPWRSSTPPAARDLTAVIVGVLGQ